MLHLSFHNRFQTGSQIHKQARRVNDSTASLSPAERWTITGAPNENIVQNQYKHSIVKRILVFKR